MKATPKGRPSGAGVSVAGLQHRDFGSRGRWRSGARQPARSWGGPEKGQRGWGEIFTPPRAICNTATANPELLVFKMASRKASLLPRRYVNEYPVKKLLGSFKGRQILLADELIFSLCLTCQPVLPATFPLASAEFANIC